MWNRLIFIAGVTVTLATAAAAQSDIPCFCRDTAGQHPLGTIVCMRIGDSERLVRCERVQNNTSWRILTEGCPTAAGPATAPMTPKPTAHARL